MLLARIVKIKDLTPLLYMVRGSGRHLPGGRRPHQGCTRYSREDEEMTPPSIKLFGKGNGISLAAASAQHLFG